MENELYQAVCAGDFPAVAALLEQHPNLNVNWGYKSNFDSTSLHIACNRGHADMVKLLLAHRDIDVNRMNKGGSTPLIWACTGGFQSTVRLMLEDPRVQVNLTNSDKVTAARLMAQDGQTEVMGWLLALRGDQIDLTSKSRPRRGRPIDGAYCPEMNTLLENFRADPVQTRHELRLKMGLAEALSAEFFALIIFLCDGLLRTITTTTSASSTSASASTSTSTSTATATATAIRFFAIVQKLPMELQMILCHRMVGSKKEIVLSKDSEAAFKRLGSALQSSKRKKK